jgi:hypothetical protein
LYLNDSRYGRCTVVVKHKEHIVVPTSQKKPPYGTLTKRGEAKNRTLAQICIRVEYALAGSKRSRCVKDTLRNTLPVQPVLWKPLQVCITCGSSIASVLYVVEILGFLIPDNVQYNNVFVVLYVFLVV